MLIFLAIIFIIMFVFGTIIYIFVPNIRQKINDYIVGFGLWLATTLHIPTWVVTFVRWLWHTFRPAIFALLAMTALLLIAWVVSFFSQSSIILVRVTAIITIILTFVAISSSEGTKGIRKIFGGEKNGLTGPIQRTSTNLLLLSAIVALLTFLPGDQFFSSACLYSLGIYAALLIIWMVAGWESNSPVTVGTKVLKWTFVILIPIVMFQHWSAGNIKLPETIELRIKNFQSKQKATNALVKAETNNNNNRPMYMVNNAKICYDKNGVPIGMLPTNSRIRIALKDTITKDGLVLYMAYQTNPIKKAGYIDMTRITVSSDWKKESNKLHQLNQTGYNLLISSQYKVIKTLSKVNQKWSPPNPYAYYYIKVPARSIVIIENTHVRKGKKFNNSENETEKIFKWKPMMQEGRVFALFPKKIKIKILEKITI